MHVGFFTQLLLNIQVPFSKKIFYYAEKEDYSGAKESGHITSLIKGIKTINILSFSQLLTLSYFLIVEHKYFKMYPRK